MTEWQETIVFIRWLLICPRSRFGPVAVCPLLFAERFKVAVRLSGMTKLKLESDVRLTFSAAACFVHRPIRRRLG